MAEITPRETVQAGPLKAEIANGHRILSWMSTKARNAMMRDSMHTAASRWRAEFVPMRFTAYVKRSPFTYKYSRAIAWHRAKAPLGLFDQVAMQFDGYNPYSKGAVAVFGAKYEAFLKYWRSQGKYRTSITGDYTTAKQDYRVWVKRNFRNAFTKWYDATKDTALPLMLSGQLSNAVLTGQVIARSTTKNTKATVTLPRLDRQNPQAVRVLGTVPLWEVKSVARWFRDTLLAAADSAAAARAMANAEAQRLQRAKQFLAAEARGEKQREKQAARAAIRQTEKAQQAITAAANKARAKEISVINKRNKAFDRKWDRYIAKQERDEDRGVIPRKVRAARPRRVA